MQEIPLARGRRRLQSIPGVLCAFHSVIDGWVRLTPERLRALLDSAGVDVRALLDAPVPEEVRTVEDLLCGLLHSLTQGKALQRVIRDEAAHRWLLENLHYDRLRLGGTSANMAAAIAALGVPRVVTYAHPLTHELAALFPMRDNLFVLTPEGAAHPREAARAEGLFALHWIIEYDGGLSLIYQGVELKAPRANRFIPAWNPINNQLRLNPELVQSAVAQARSFSHLMLSGYHLLSERYPDGSDFRPSVDETGSFVKGLRKANPNLRVHLECASMASASLRRYVEETIVPLVHSLGCNEVELAGLVEALGGAPPSQDILREDPVAILRGAFRVAEATGVPRIHVHTLGYYLCLSADERVSWEQIQESLCFAAALAAARAQARELTDDNWAAGLDIAPSLAGQTAQRVLEPMLQNRAEKVSQGVWKSGKHWIVIEPTRVVPQPKLTVGLGDTISAAAFLTGA
ncbi:MAG: hypothetical protein HY023_17555 [Chloroflexi bacterium]|nr:hypothetical protein [Chloroflexota bacterium]